MRCRACSDDASGLCLRLPAVRLEPQAPKSRHPISGCAHVLCRRVCGRDAAMDARHAECHAFRPAADALAVSLFRAALRHRAGAARAPEEASEVDEVSLSYSLTGRAACTQKRSTKVPSKSRSRSRSAVAFLAWASAGLPLLPLQHPAHCCCCCCCCCIAGRCILGSTHRRCFRAACNARAHCSAPLRTPAHASPVPAPSAPAPHARA